MVPTLAVGVSVPSVNIAEVGGAASPLTTAYILARPFFGSPRASSSSFFLSLTLSVSATMAYLAAALMNSSIAFENPL